MHKENCLLFLSGELAPDEAARFRAHLGGCAECRDWLETARSAGHWAEALKVEVPERLVRAALERAGAHGAGGFRPARRALATAFAALLAAVAIVLVPRRRAGAPEWDASGLHAELVGAADGIRDAERSLAPDAGGIQGVVRGAEALRERERLLRELLDAPGS